MRHSNKSKSIIPSLHLPKDILYGSFVSFRWLAASKEIDHFKYDDDLELTRCTWLQADHAYECIWVVEVASSETPTALSDRHIERWGPKQVYIRRTCSLIGGIIVEVVWDPLYQDISHPYIKEIFRAHRSLWHRRGQLCLRTARYNHSSFSRIVESLTMVQKWSTSALQRQ
jgi:hypothetical protein